jgi:hypothetical protein
MPAISEASAYENQINDETGEEEQSPGQILSERDIVEVLRNWDTRGRERPHEPSDEQISMEEAIAIGRAGFARIGEYLMPEVGLSINQSSAFLSQNILLDQNTFFDPMFSFWTVTFSGDDVINATLRINAVSGQIWRIDIHRAEFAGWAAFTVQTIDEILNDFTSELGIRSLDESVVTIEANERGISAYKSFADDDARVFLHATGRQTGENEWRFIHFSIMLTSQWHHFV